MKANNLTICVPYKGCDKNCPYCVSKMTGQVKSNPDLMVKNMHKVKHLAAQAQVTSVLITGKGEPFLNIQGILTFCNMFKNYPIEVQTNGIWLGKNYESRIFNDLSCAGINVIAISVDNISKQENQIIAITQYAHKFGILVRVTFNIINDKFISSSLGGISFEELIKLSKFWKIDQMTMRAIVKPNNIRSTDVSKWIDKNVDKDFYSRLKKEMSDILQIQGFLIRRMPHGSVYDYKGLSISYSDYCMQDKNDLEDIRSLIFMDDGHLYTNWNSKASVLF
jgi:organic radical activating enzyme